MRSANFAFVISMLFFIGLNCTARAAGSDNVELVYLKTVDGVKLTGALRPAQPVSQKAGVIMIHGYSGNFYSDIMEFLPQALSAGGLNTLAINMRDHDQVPKKNLFEENRHDIAAAVDEMERRGYNPIFLYGHSMGTNRVLYYQAETGDPRVAGVVLTGPPGNLYEWNVRLFGAQTAAQVLHRAQKLKAGGKGDEWMLIDLGPLGKSLYTANHLVSLRGPQTFSDPFKNMARVSIPVLIVHGLADRLAEHTIADRLHRQAGSGTKVKVVKIVAADHQFRDHQQDLAGSIKSWLHKQLQ